MILVSFKTTKKEHNLCKTQEKKNIFDMKRNLEKKQDPPFFACT